MTRIDRLKKTSDVVRGMIHACDGGADIALELYEIATDYAAENARLMVALASIVEVRKARKFEQEVLTSSPPQNALARDLAHIAQRALLGDEAC